MKHIITITALLFFSVAANAQTTPLFPRGINTELMRGTFATIVLYIISAFILAVIRIVLNDRLKKKMLDKWVSVEVIDEMLPRKNELTLAIKWFCILIAISVGLLIISLTPPLGIQSVAIMAFCVAMGFLGFYFWAKRLDK
jgi:hypothetical protein